MPDALRDDLNLIRDTLKSHKYALPGKDHDFDKLGDFVLNEDGSKKHADDCEGCEINRAVDRIEAEIDRIRTVHREEQRRSADRLRAAVAARSSGRIIHGDALD